MSTCSDFGMASEDIVTDVLGRRQEVLPDGSTTGISACLGMFCSIGVVPPPPWYNGGVIDARARIEWARGCRSSAAAEEGNDESGEHISPPDSEPCSGEVDSLPLPIRRRSVSNARRLRRWRTQHTSWHPSTGHYTWTSSALRTRRCASFLEKEGRGARRVTTDANQRLLRLEGQIDRLRARVRMLERQRRRDVGADDTADTPCEATADTEPRTVEEAPPPRL